MSLGTFKSASTGNITNPATISGTAKAQEITNYTPVIERAISEKTGTESTIIKSVDELANEVINGAWGVNPERKQRLEAAGYDYNAIQKRVNEVLAGNPATPAATPSPSPQVSTPAPAPNPTPVPQTVPPPSVTNQTNTNLTSQNNLVGAEPIYDKIRILINDFQINIPELVDVFEALKNEINQTNIDHNKVLSLYYELKNDRPQSIRANQIDSANIIYQLEGLIGQQLKGLIPDPVAPPPPKQQPNQTPAPSVNSNVKFDMTTDYSLLIKQALESGNYAIANEYRIQRNAKIEYMTLNGLNPNGYTINPVPYVAPISNSQAIKQAQTPIPPINLAETNQLITTRSGCNVYSNQSQLDVGLYGVQIDKIAADDNRRMKLIVKNETTGVEYKYDLTGEMNWIPLTAGSGEYTISYYIQQQGTAYINLTTTKIDYQEKNIEQLYLQSNIMIPWDNNTLCIQKAKELVIGKNTDAEKLKAIEDYILANFTYDRAYAQNYVSWNRGLDETFSMGQGICGEFSAIFAAMLRAVDIPTKLVFGYTGRDYHAWNEVYIDGKWVLQDMTFLSSGRNNPSVVAYIADSTNYLPAYVF